MILKKKSLKPICLTKAIRNTITVLFLTPFFCLAEKPSAFSDEQPPCETKTAAQFCFNCKIQESSSGFSSLQETGQALQKAKLSEEAQYIINSMSKIARCPDRIWPGLALTQEPYIVLDKSNNTAIVVTHDECGNPSYRSPTSSELTKDHFAANSTYEVTLINNKERVVIKLLGKEKKRFVMSRQPKEVSFSLLVHEAFHVCDQSHKHWKKNDDPKKDRFSEKAEGCNPRRHRAYIRYYLEEALREDVNSPAYKTAIQKAAWWNKKYKESFPEEFEAVNVTDVTEGSAEFVTIQANALLEKGCQVREEELNAAYAEQYFKGRGKYPKVLPFPDAESYNIGSLASALLERSSSPEWQKKVAKGTSPVQLLLKGASPLKPTGKIQEIEDGCRFFENMEKHRELSLENINRHLESEDHVALSITYTKETRKGTIRIMGNASSGLKGYDQALLDVQTAVDTGASDIAFNNVHLLRPEKTVNKCGNNQRVILIPRRTVSVKQNSSVSEIDFSEEKDTINNATGQETKLKSSLKGKVTVGKKIKQKGADIWCAK